jgi:hypothetical protein
MSKSDPFVVVAAAARIMTGDIRKLNLAAHDTSPDAMVVDTSSKKIPPSWLGVIDKAVADKQISRGDRVELLSRVAYILARDHAYVGHYQQAPSLTCTKDDVLLVMNLSPSHPF